MKTPLDRRTLLQGAGTAVALPLLDAMVPALARAASGTRGPKPPTRMAIVYVPNGIHMNDWTPAKAGPEWALTPILRPLATVKPELLVLTGLEQHAAFPQGDGTGGHARALSAFLTGAHPVKTFGANIRGGISVDQMAAAKIGHLTRLPSLELGIDAGAQSGNCDPGYSCAYTTNISWKTPTLPVAKEIDPAKAFDRLFGGDPARDRRRRSVLDFVKADLESLETKLGPTDRRKIDEYLTGVRELEQRIDRFGALPPPQAPALNRPEDGARDLEEHIRIMADLIVAAFQTDTTRVCTFMMANESANKSHPMLDIHEGHHDLSHHQGQRDKQEKISRINRFYMTHFAYLLEKLKGIREAGGTLLDHAMVMYGSGMSDGDLHNHDDLPILLAGRGGGTLRTGRHIRFGSYDRMPINNLYLSLLDRMGVAVETFGNSQARLPGLDSLESTFVTT